MIETIKNEQVTPYCHTSLADMPNKTADEMKEFFDAMPKKVIIPKINELVDELNSGGYGKSAYQVAVDNGFEGSEQEWLASLCGDDCIGGEVIEGYIVASANEFAKRVNRRQSGDSFCFAFMSDAHVTKPSDSTVASAKHAGQVLSILNKRVPLDAVVHGGDYTWGAAADSKERIYDDFELYQQLIGTVTAGTPNIYAVGNHDDLPYKPTDERLNENEVFGAIGRINRQAGAVCESGCNYGYVDFDAQRVRIIYVDTEDKRCLQSPDYVGGESNLKFLNYHNISKPQLDFIVDKALDFSDKTDFDSWTVIVVSHFDLGIGADRWKFPEGENFRCNVNVLAKILGAYKNGSSVSDDVEILNSDGTHTLTTCTFNFSGIQNRVKRIVVIHGDSHNLSESILPGNIVSIGCPNVLNGRESVGTDGKKYEKTAGTQNATAFCVITLDKQNGRVFADCYGAGYDRDWLI